jgi:hypothetical protein
MALKILSHDIVVYNSILEKIVKILHIITGPIASGKTTLKKKLVKEYKTNYVHEYQFGIDTFFGEWQDLINYAKKENTIVIESHMSYNHRDPGDPNAVMGRIKQPPINLMFHIILPTEKDIKILCQRWIYRERWNETETSLFSSNDFIKQVKEDIDWYKKFSIQIPSNQKKLYKVNFKVVENQQITSQGKHNHRDQNLERGHS